MNNQILPVILVCLMMSMSGCLGSDSESPEIIEYTYDSESRVYEHNFTSVMGAEIMSRDIWNTNNSSTALADLSFSYQKSPLSDGWVNITITENDTIFFYTNTSDMGSEDFNNLTQEPLGENWTITIHAKGSDYSLEQGGFFHDRYYLNMTVDYRNQTK